MSDAQIGLGSAFKRGATSVGEVLSIGAPSLSRDVVDATHMQSTEGWREFIAGLKDGGEATVEIQSKPSTPAYQAMVADFGNDSPESYSIEFPDGSSWAFSAFITGLETSDPLDDKITTSATFKITGKPTFAAS
jgi:predicted secreted protein